MHGPYLPREAPRTGRHGRIPLLAIASALAVLCLLPGGSIGSPPPSATMSHRPVAPATTTLVRPPPATLSGAVPSGRIVDGPAVFHASHSYTVEDPSAASPPAARRTSAPGLPAPVAAPQKGAVAPGASGPGWVRGIVVDSLYGTALAGVDVRTSKATGCSNCQNVSTNSTGFFRVAADAGFVTVQFDDDRYVENVTTANVTSGSVGSVGTIELVHFALVYGVVAADLPGHPGLAAVSVTSVSRDFGESGPDSNFSTSNGSFRLYVDPLPAEVDLSPASAAYLPNSTDVATTPWQVLDVGTVLLEGGVVADVKVVDSSTGAAILGASGRYCSDRIDGTCFNSRNDTNGTLPFDAVAGPGYVVVGASGYVTNVTQVPVVPSGTSGPVDLGTVRLLPLGVVEVTVNFTGGTPNGTWPITGGFEIVACSLSGMEVGTGIGGQILPKSCVITPASLGQTVLAPASPLRDVIYVVRCYAVPTGFPIAEYDGSPGGCPNPESNVTWANVTPDQSTYLGSFNVEAGTYLSGTLEVTGPQANSTTLVVGLQACSTVRLNECAPPVQSNNSGRVGGVPAGCPTTAWTFCVPSPPGPVRLTAVWGPVRNFTWVTVPTGCCSQEGHPMAVGTLGFDTDLGPVGTIYGRIALAGQPASVIPPAGWDASVEVCTALRSLQPCENTSVGQFTGTFTESAPAGWDSVDVTAGGYRANRTWIDVGVNNSTGTIEISANGAVAGQVVSAATGDPILEAQVSACDLASSMCQGLGLVTNSNGTFDFPLGTLPYPGGTFAIEVTAAGYDPESTFANVTSGATAFLPPLRLPPIGIAGARPSPFAPRGANSSTPTTGSWVTGRLIDRSSGLGVGFATILVCELLASNSCSYSSGQTSTGGEFNLSTVHGAYELWLNSSYYQSVELFLNASAAGTVALGSVNTSELPRLSGRVLIDPWESLGSTLHEGADQAIVTVCATASQCGPLAVTGPAGYFNASAPETGSVSVQFVGSGPTSTEGNGDPGFSSTIVVTAISNWSRLSGSGPGGAVPLSILGGVTGYLDEFGGAPERPAGFTTYGIRGNGTGTSAGYYTGGAGYYVAFLPAGASGWSVDASAYGLVPTSSSATGGTIVAGAVAAGPNLLLDRFGFVTATAHDASTGRPVGGVFFTASGTGGSGNTLVGFATTNGSGGVNITAPPGGDTLTAGSPVYQNWSGNATVPVGGLDALGSVSLRAIPNGGIVVLRSAQLNTVTGPVVPGAHDNLTGSPVPQAVVEETGAAGVDAGPVLANDLGQFFLAGIPAGDSTLSIDGTGFNPLTIVRNLSGAATSTYAPLNLTAGGILEGTVVAEPGNVTVPYATVSVCAIHAATCRDTVTTNSTGAFWVWAPNATVSVTVVSNLYLSNLTRLVNVPADSFLEIGKIPVYSFGTVHGIVRGLPSGGLLPGANASVCSQYSPAHACLADESVTTDANGSFSMESPPGLYFLYVTYPGYNASRFEFVLGPGQNLNFGVVVLEADGVEVGTIVTPSGGGLPGATVLSCGSYSAATCVGTVSASDGGFRLLAPPGPSTLTVSAQGYLDTVVGTTVGTGTLDDLGAIVLQPAPPDIFENVTGYVTSAADGGPLAGALLVASEAGTRVAQAYSVGTGAYDLEVRWGTPTLLVELPGYRTVRETLAVHANVSDVNFSLSAMLYGVDGVTFDGGTGSVLAGVVLTESGLPVATSASDGTFHLDLPNGSVTLVATHPTVGAVVYGTVPLPILVSGRAVQHDLTIPRTVVPLSGAVVDAATGRGVLGASVALWGSSGAEVTNASTGGFGSFDFAVGPGTYNVSVLAPGYEPANVTVVTGPAGTRTTVALLVAGASKSSASTILPEVAEAAAVLAVAAVGGVVLLRWDRRRPPAGERYYRPGEPIPAVDEPPT